MRKLLLLPGLALALSCRGCDQDVKRIRPAIVVSPVSFDFGKVKAGASAEVTVTVSSATRASLAVSSVSIEGGGSAFAVADPPSSVPGLTDHKMRVAFSPTELRAYEAAVVIASNDEENPETRVSLAGEGAKPTIAVTPECLPAKKCTGTATVEPPAIDFAPEPFERRLLPDVTTLPTVAITNLGEVGLLVTKLAIEGADAAAFKFTGNSALPPGGLPIGAGEGVSLSIRFTPTSESQVDYASEVVIQSDDSAKPEVRVKLTGKLRPNLPPKICANVVKVIPGDGSAPIDYSSKQEWDLLLTLPAGGYDFTQSRDVQPKSVVAFSAISDAADQTKCTSDPEDGRIGLSWQWKLISTPAGSSPIALGGAATSQATLTPFATGEYVVELTVKDTQGHAATTTLKFVVALKEDLVAQLSWNGFSDVDLDVHLVRPTSTTPGDPFSGAFSFFEEGSANKTSGDVNGWALITRQNNPGFDFEWGDVGTFDDPRLNIDDTGSGQLLENVSLNYPENDPRCQSSACSYKVMVHYFRDARASSPAPCTVDGGTSCKDGDRCDCAFGTRCVANDAPKTSAPSGAGKCFVPPEPVVRIFFRGNPTPAAVIPLDTLNPPDKLVLPAPCQMLYLADVLWPAKGDGGVTDAGPQVLVQGADGGYVTDPKLARFGFRQQNSLQCSPNLTKGAVDWYGAAP
ncbi:MAG: choice-of-anchor D domain-containing protein [Myxococcales bacterium]|nr:choice-of-anchor D domain-containing protein [Myxococcales bacterium]